MTGEQIWKYAPYGVHHCSEQAYTDGEQPVPGKAFDVATRRIAIEVTNCRRNTMDRIMETVGRKRTKLLPGMSCRRHEEVGENIPSKPRSEANETQEVETPVPNTRRASAVGNKNVSQPRTMELGLGWIF